MMAKTIHGPRGIRIELDLDQVFPDNPGEGTPAMVHLGSDSGTYWCAIETGELSSKGSYLDDDQCSWLNSKQTDVEEFLFGEGV